MQTWIRRVFGSARGFWSWLVFALVIWAICFAGLFLPGSKMPVVSAQELESNTLQKLSDVTGAPHDHSTAVVETFSAGGACVVFADAKEQGSTICILYHKLPLSNRYWYDEHVFPRPTDELAGRNLVIETSNWMLNIRAEIKDGQMRVTKTPRVSVLWCTIPFVWLAADGYRRKRAQQTQAGKG